MYALSISGMPGKSVSIGEGFSHRGREEIDLSTRLFVNVFGRQSELRDLGDTRGPEFESRKDPTVGYTKSPRRARDVLLGLYVLLFVFIVFYAPALIYFCSIVFGFVAISLLVKFGP